MLGNRYAAELVRLLQTRQIPPQQTLHNTGLDWDQLQSDEQLVRRHHMKILVRNARQLYGSPDLGLQYGRRLNTNTHGILGFAAMSCSTLNELIQTWLKYHSINYPDLELNYRVEDGAAILQAQLRSQNSSEQIFAKEVLFSSVYTTVGFLLDELPQWTELRFDYPAPAYLSSYVDVFQQSPKFSQPHCQLRVPVEVLDKPLPSANPAAARIYQQQCAEMLRSMTLRHGLARQVQKLLLENSSHFPRIAEVAAQLHMSERTLRRRLTAEGTSFQEVFNDVRCKLAGEYLDTTRLSVADIADLLGFADPSNFRRAYIQWSGESPAQHRRQDSHHRGLQKAS